MRLRVAARDRVELRLRARERRAGREPRDGGEVAEARFDLRRREAAQLVDARRPDVGAVERRRQIDAEDADDRVRRAVERQHRADRIGTRGKAPQPVPAADDRDVRRSALVVGKNERASGGHGHTQHIEEARRDAKARQLLGLILGCRVEAIGGECSEPGEHAIPRGEVDQRRIRKRTVARAAARVRARQHEEAAAVAKRQRPQQRGIDDAEDRRRRADPDRDDRDRDEGEFPRVDE